MPWKKTVVSWIYNFPRSEVFNHPSCDPAVFNATCITIHESVFGELDDPLGPSYKLVDAKFNVYGVAKSGNAVFVITVGEVTSFAYFQEMQGGKWITSVLTDSCPAPTSNDFGSSPYGTNNLESKYDKLKPSLHILEDHVGVADEICITALQIETTGVLGKRLQRFKFFTHRSGSRCLRLEP
jgi:hypothetical protein